MKIGIIIPILYVSKKPEAQGPPSLGCVVMPGSGLGLPGGPGFQPLTMLHISQT